MPPSLAQTAGFCSVGHSNRSIDEFRELLLAARVGLVVDVRSFPMSRSNPVFNTDRLPQHLEPAGIAYLHMRALGGRRPKQRAVDPTLNATWRVQSFHNYADYALGDDFAAAFAQLVDLGRASRVAMMCSEAVWWRCHRRIIVDYLLAIGHAVDHLMGIGQVDRATMTPGAKVTVNGNVVYPKE